jgi:hypothetical protein
MIIGQKKPETSSEERGTGENDKKLNFNPKPKPISQLVHRESSRQLASRKKFGQRN